MTNRSRVNPYDVSVRRLERRRVLNRLNALKSTGPKSQEGKSRSSQNARTHGLTAQKYPLSINCGDEETLSALILERHPSAEPNDLHNYELSVLVKSLQELHSRFAHIQREKAKIHSSLTRPSPLFNLASPAAANPFLSAKRQAGRVISLWKDRQSKSKERSPLRAASAILKSLGRNEPDRLKQLKTLNRYERDTLAQLRKIARRIASVKSSLTEQSTLHDLKPALTET